MSRQCAGIALTAAWLAGGCAPYHHIDPAEQTVEKQGIWVSGEYAYFEASDSRVFILRLPNPRDQRRFVALAPVREDAAQVCLAMRIQGGVDGEVDGTGRPVFVVSKIFAATPVECKSSS